MYFRRNKSWVKDQKYIELVLFSRIDTNLYEITKVRNFEIETLSVKEWRFVILTIEYCENQKKLDSNYLSYSLNIWIKINLIP